MGLKAAAKRLYFLGSAERVRSEKAGIAMKKGIHPKYMDCKVSCGCGQSFTTRSTVPEVKIEICSQCHPFYTGGGDKIIDTLGRVDRFTKKFGGEYFKKDSKKKPNRQTRA